MYLLCAFFHYVFCLHYFCPPQLQVLSDHSVCFVHTFNPFEWRPFMPTNWYLVCFESMVDYFWLTSFLWMFKVSIANYLLILFQFLQFVGPTFFGFCRLFIYIHFPPRKVGTSIFGHVLLPLKKCSFSTCMVHHVLLSTFCYFVRESMCEAILTLIKWKQDLKCNKLSFLKHWKNIYCKLVLYVV